MENEEKRKLTDKYNKEIQGYLNKDKIRAEINEMLEERALKNRAERKDISDREINTIATIIQKVLCVYNILKISVAAFMLAIKFFKKVFISFWEKGKK